MNNYGLMSGTSMAAPVVSGIAALVTSANPNLTANEIADRIKRNVQKSDKLTGKVSSGGIVNALAAIDNVPPSSQAGSNTTTPIAVTIQNNDQNKDVSKAIEIVKDYNPGNKTIKPLVGETDMSDPSKSVSDSVYSGVDTTPSNIMEQEPNNTLSSSTVITSNTLCNGNISINTDVDWYAIDAVKAGKLTVSLTGIPTGCDYDIEVYDSSTVCIGGSYLNGNANEKASILINSAGRYYIRVYSSNGYNANSNY